MRRTPLLLCGVLMVAACTRMPAGDGTSPHTSSISSISSFSSSSVSSFSSLSSFAAQPVTRNPKLATPPVPFTSQAPHANWDDPYQEACEEAAILMVVHYLNGTPLTPEIADRDILDLVAWETENGYDEDITAAQMAEVARVAPDLNRGLPLRARVRTDVTEETIREELAAGNPVIVPAAGRDLGNPYFSGEGPWYHALVIIGYERGWTGRRWFIVNDPGTKRGKRYEYDVDTLLNAIHDWTGVKEEIRAGKKAMVILEK